MQLLAIAACLAVAATGAAAKTIDVAWGLPSLAGKAAWEPVTAAVGDKIKFKWAGGLSYGLYQVSTGKCMPNEEAYEDTPGAVIKEATHATPAFEYTFVAEKPGTYFFVDPDACEKGAKLEVVVA